MKDLRLPGYLKVAIAYLRASTDEQLLSPDAQRACIRTWAVREQVKLAAWHLDLGVSSVAPVEARPALRNALLELPFHRAGLLVVARRDRIARDVVLAAQIEHAAARAGARLVSALGEGNGDSPADAFMRTVIDGAAQYERGLIRARTRSALAAKRARASAALMVQPVCGWWQVKHVRPFVPRFWKKALFAVIVATPGWNVAIRPLGSSSISSFLMMRGVGCEPWSGSLWTRMRCA